MLLEYLTPTVDIIEFLSNRHIASERDAKATRDNNDNIIGGGGFSNVEEGDEEGW